MVVPLASAGGPFPLIAQTRDGVALTPAFHELATRLRAIHDLALVVLDPLQTFAHADINADPMAGQILFSALAGLAAGTGATIIVAHHMKKSNKPVVTRAEARDAIRGTSAIVDGGRFTIAVWPASGKDEQDVLRQLHRPVNEQDAVFMCAVVKGNSGQSKAVRTLVRDVNNGILKDATALAAPAAKWSVIELDQIKTIIAGKAEAGVPFTRTGNNGLYARRHELGHPLSGYSKTRLPEMADALLGNGELVLTRHLGGQIQYLDVPGGYFDRGMGELKTGGSGRAPSHGEAK